MTGKKTSDEQLALELFAGRMVRTKRGRLKLEYPSGPREQLARLALARVLNSWNPEETNVSFIMLGLVTALLAPEGRKLVFRAPRRGRPSTYFADAKIDRYVTAKERDYGKTEAAIEDAMKEFGLRRKGIFDARRRQRKFEEELEALEQKVLARVRGPVSFNQD